MSILKIENVSFKYNDNLQALDDVSFSVEKGEFVCILGHNGSGKSTLSKLIMGLEKATSGDIIIDDVVLNEDTVEDLRHKLGIVFQNPDNQFIGITVKDDIAFGLENRTIDRNTMLEAIDYYSKLVGINHLLNRNPESLSGGEKQKVAIAGILAINPDIIIFDESTSMLDPKSVSELLKTIKSLKGEKTIIYITHNLQEALLADKVIILKEGKLLKEGSVTEVFTDYELLKEAHLETFDLLNLIKMIDEKEFNRSKEVKDFLWQLTYQK